MSRASTPARKTTALVNSLKGLERAERVDDLALKRLRREAQTLMKVDAVGAHSILGAMAGIEGNAAQVRKHYEIALQISARESEVLTNYAAALSKAGKMNDAFKTVTEAHERHPDDLSILQDAINIAAQGARFREGRVLCERRRKLRPEGPHDDEATMIALTEAVGREAFDEEAAQEVVQIAHEIRLAAGARYAGSGPAPVYGEPDTFGFDILVRVPPTEAADLNAALAERVAGNELLMDRLKLNFVPTFIGTTLDVGDTTGAA